MSKNIAVLLDKNEETTSFDKPGIINVYTKENGSWYIIKEIPFDISSSRALSEVRDKFIRLGNALDDSKILVAKQITGAAYNVLDTIGFNLWELEGKPNGFLEYVLENEEKDEASEELDDDKNDGIYPVKYVKDGYYSINLKELQETNSGITTKQALVPFLENHEFYELEIVCGHIPPWFEGKFEKLNLKTEVIQNGTNDYKIIVSHKTCTE